MSISFNFSSSYLKKNPVLLTKHEYVVTIKTHFFFSFMFKFYTIYLHIYR
ncbi:hypothetical protein HanIR_Chr03g0149011 [Helianthus annuus]|nr:hypothetical protein HanIR_Chr03g0149011 [Helianthus annuus]